MYYHFHYSYDNLTIITIVSLFINVYLLNYFSPGGGIGRRKGLKIPRGNTSCRFESGPRHQIPTVYRYNQHKKIKPQKTTDF